MTTTPNTVLVAQSTSGTARASTAVGGAGALAAADFMTLLIAQLQNQDPLEPLGPSEFMAQLAQLQSVTQLEVLNATMREFAESQAMVGPASLLGRQVTWLDSSGLQQQGAVTELRREGAALLPVVEGHVVTWERITAVR